MKYFLKKAILPVLLFAPGAAFAAHWSYEGAESAEHWGELDQQYRQCRDGQNQSPVDIHSALKTHLHPLKIDHKAAPDSIINNGHTIQVNYPAKTANKVLIDNELFYAQQFHFHVPSENTIDGKHYPLEMHMVYKNKDNEIAVVAVMFEKGSPNKTIAALWDMMPDRSNESHKISSELDLDMLLPENMAYYRFTGSLTTPPCNEGVRWLLLKHAVSLSEKQQKKFLDVMHHTNNRPTQALHGRQILE